MHFYTDFAAMLFLATVFFGLVCLVDRGILHPRRKAAAVNGVVPKPNKFLEFSLSIFPTLLVVCVLRSFLAEPFRIPSGSMKPNLLEGDFVLVNKYSYGLRLPGFGIELMRLGQPVRGDIMIFRHPEDVKINYIKRVVGLPGDEITYKDNELSINGEKIEKKFLSREEDANLGGPAWPVLRFEEKLNGHVFNTYNRPGVHYDMEARTVPSDHYLVIGDNRDNSRDGRHWGFVHRDLVIGHAVMVWLSWDPVNKDVRWDRIGTKL